MLAKNLCERRVRVPFLQESHRFRLQRIPISREQVWLVGDGSPSPTRALRGPESAGSAVGQHHPRLTPGTTRKRVN